MANISQLCPIIPQAMMMKQKSYSKFGALRAATSPCHDEANNAIKVASCDGKYPALSVGGAPTFAFQYMPERPVNTGTSAGPSCVATDNLYHQPLTRQYTYNPIRTADKTVNQLDFRGMCCDADDFFRRSGRADRVTLNGVRDILDKHGITYQVQDQLAKDFEAKILIPAERNMLNAIAANVGFNYATGSTATVVMPAITSFAGPGATAGPGVANLAFLEQLDQNKLLSQNCGDCIQVITGTGLAVNRFMQGLKNVKCCNMSNGFSYESYLADPDTPEFMWYRSTEIDTLFGANTLFVVFSNSIAYQSVYTFPQLHGDSHGMTHYEGGAIRDFNCDDESATLAVFDLRIQEVECRGGQAYPSWNIFADYQDFAWAKFAGMESLVGNRAQWTGILRYQFT